MDDTAPTTHEDQLRTQVLAERESARLLAEQLQTEHDHLGCAGPDLFKQVTGHNSLEKALEDARRLVASYDRVLAQLDAGQADVTVLAGRLGVTTRRGVAV
jgi:hypothetical protein